MAKLVWSRNSAGPFPPVSEIGPMPISTPTRRHKLRLLAALSATLVATAVSAAYPAWKPDTFYAAGTIVSYSGHDYQALVDQTDYSSTGWNPTTTSLWKDLGASS